MRKEDSHSPSPDQEKEIALPQTNDSGDSHSSDLLGKSPIAARVACIDILEKATRTIERLTEYHPFDDTDGAIILEATEALNHIALVARFGAGIPNPAFRRFGATGSDVTEGATETFKSGIAKYAANGAEAAAWADGYTSGFSDQNLAAAKLIEDAAARIRQGEDPAMHSGSVGPEGGTPPGE